MCLSDWSAMAGNAKSLTDAFNHPTRSLEWWHAALEEFEGLTDMGVFDHDYTRAMLDELGIHTIIPLSVCLDHKYDADGMLNRLKVRMALAGHKGNLRKGEHFFHTFAFLHFPFYLITKNAKKIQNY